MPMRTLTAFCTSALLLASLPAVAQSAPAATASSMVTPALDQLRQSLGAVRLEKWKAPGAVREEASNNMGSINRDLDGTLPGLLATADAAPGVVSKNLPVFRNLDAVYDVLLRVVESADRAAPGEQAQTLHSALNALENARHTLGDSLQASAVNAETQASSLRDQLRAQAAPPPPPAVVNDGGKRTPAASPHKHHNPKPPPQPQ